MSTKEIILEGGSPWGFRMQGGSDSHLPLKVARVNLGSKASLKGIREGDIITSINGQSTRHITYSQAHSLLRNSGHMLTLGLNENAEGSPLRRKYSSKTNETHSETTRKTSAISYSLTPNEIIESKRNSEEFFKNSETNCKQRYQTTNGSKRESQIDSPPVSPTSISTLSSDISVTSTLAEAGTECVTTSASLNPVNKMGNSKRKRTKNKRKTFNSSSKNCVSNDVKASDNELVNDNENVIKQDNIENKCKVDCRSENKTLEPELMSIETSKNIKLSSEGIETNLNNNTASKSDHEVKISYEDKPQLGPYKIPQSLNASDPKTELLYNYNFLSETNNIKHELDPCGTPQNQTLTSEDIKIDITAANTTKLHFSSKDNLSVPTNNIQTNTVLPETNNYKVDFPTEPNKTIQAKSLPCGIPKSKSLDGDDFLKIEEVSDASDVEMKACTKALITEVESDPDLLDEDDDLAPNSKFGVQCLDLDENNDLYNSPTEFIAPDVELSLRSYLNGLNLALAPVETKNDQKQNALEEQNKRKAQKKAALAQYFVPFMHNPRYLEEITEESDCCSDFETRKHVKQSSPELEAPKKLKVRHSKRSRRAAKEEDTLLVSAKIVDTPSASETVECNYVQENLELAETVFLDDSSTSSSARSSMSDADEDNENTGKNTDGKVSPTKNIEITVDQLTPPPTPKNSPKNETCDPFKSAALEANNFEESKNTQIFIGITEDSIKKSDNPTKIEDDTKVDNFKVPENILPFTKSLTEDTNSLQETRDSMCNLKNISPENKNKTPCEKLTGNLNSVEDDLDRSRSDSGSSNSLQSTVKLSCNLDEEFIPKYNAESLATLCINSLLRFSFGLHVLQKVANIDFATFDQTLYESEIPCFKNKESGTKGSRDGFLNDKKREIIHTLVLDKNCHPDINFEKERNNFGLEEKQNSYADNLGSQKENADLIVSKFNDAKMKQIVKSSTLDQKVQTVKVNEESSLSDTCNEWSSLNEIPEICTSQKEEANSTDSSEDVKVGNIFNTNNWHDNVSQIKSTNSNTGYIGLLNILKEHSDFNCQNVTSPEPCTLDKYNKDAARLKVNTLSEWLSLARPRCNSFNEVNIQRLDSTNNSELLASGNNNTSITESIFEQHLLRIKEKERQILHELEYLEEEKRKLQAEMAPSKTTVKLRPTSLPDTTTELFRQQMFNEYMHQVAVRQDRKQNKVIKLSSPLTKSDSNNEALLASNIEHEFMVKLKEKLGTPDDATEVETLDQDTESDVEPLLVIDRTGLKDGSDLPKHLKEFVNLDLDISPRSSDLEVDFDGVWSPGQRQQEVTPVEIRRSFSNKNGKNEAIPVVWTPASSPTVERKEFRPVSFESPVLSRKNKPPETLSPQSSPISKPQLPWESPSSTISEASSSISKASKTLFDRSLPASRSSPAINNGFSAFCRLPKVQPPTITLLQKAREGCFPKGPNYIEKENSTPRNYGPSSLVDLRYETKNEYFSEPESGKPNKMANSRPRQYSGIGPTTKEGMPLILRSEVRDQNHHKWYKKMYDTIHKEKPYKDEYVTVRYKQKRAQYPNASGYLSEPEPGAYDSDHQNDYKYQTIDRRRTPMRERENWYNHCTATMPRNVPTVKSSSSSDILGARKLATPHLGKIENYTPGHSSISDKEEKEWWDEVMDIFDGQFEHQKQPPAPPAKSFINQALRESGYESDSTLVFKRKENEASSLSPTEQKQAYKVIQQGGDVPLHGLRKVVPDKPKESPRKYLENQVNIHYKAPIRQEIKEYFSEDELAHRQAEAMKKIYEEERRRKYLQVSQSLQELQDMTSRRHTDNFIPSQKSPISLNRYDDFDVDPSPKIRPRSPEPRLVARALYNFVGQSARELTFRKGDLIYVRRQVDKNWYEGELNAMVGLFPFNYVEIVPYENVKTTPRKAHEGQARAKYNFIAQTHLELSLAKGELVVITRKVDNNWYEGKIGGRKGIFPVSYVDVLIDPNEHINVGSTSPSKPVASPAAHSLLLNGSAGGKESMGSHSYSPSLPSSLTASYHAKPIQITSLGTYGTLERPTLRNPVNQALHIDTQSDPVPFRAIYKYLPQNEDELELLEGDKVFVIEICDDGWFVGSSDRTGAFGTFPGNYVEKI